MIDVFFLSYGEPDADENFARLLTFVPEARRIDGVKGIHAAHKVCAAESRTDHFFTVDADNWVLDGFSFELPFEPDPTAVYVWRCRNAVNDLVYGYGAIKLFPAAKLRDTGSDTVDMTTSVSTDYRIVQTLASETRFNTSPFETWKSAFRECVKLSSKIIDRQKDDETIQRLEAWCSIGRPRRFWDWCIRGARDGRAYGENHRGDTKALARINDFDWLRWKFSLCQ